MDFLETPLPPVNHDTHSQTRKKKIHCKQELVVSRLQQFYAERPDIKELMPVLLGTSPTSLRLIDWFVTNYSKRHSVAYIHDGTEFLVYANYKSQLKAYSKKLFDPFCRRERILFEVPGFESFITTVGKLNFFRWAIEKNVLKYIQDNYDSIEKEMNDAMKQMPSRSKKSGTMSSTSTVDSTASETSSQTAVSADSVDSFSSAATTQTAVSAASIASTASAKTTSTGRTTRRRRADAHGIAVRHMEKHELEIVLTFD
jgi:hypothetical protein